MQFLHNRSNIPCYNPAGLERIYFREDHTLNLEKEYLEDHQVKIKVIVDDDVFEGSKRKAARKIAKRTRIPGFRPGKAPYAVIARQVGEGAIIEEAVDIVVNDIYPKVVDEAEIEPFGPGTLEEISNLEPLELEFLIPLQAEVELGDYQSIRIDYEPKEIGDEDIDQVINNLRERQAIIEPVERAAEESDQVYIILEAMPTGEDDQGFGQIDKPEFPHEEIVKFEVQLF